MYFSEEKTKSFVYQSKVNFYVFMIMSSSSRAAEDRLRILIRILNVIRPGAHRPGG